MLFSRYVVYIHSLQCSRPSSMKATGGDTSDFYGGMASHLPSELKKCE